ncbi:ABC transporter ATP-binding protein [Terasakiella pusilla]|uniref:ABC transporter ATP-binding protein n=1 Tax=Terasakiella pusilla TaxID=64973 RepID=UPI003AA85943
MTSVVNVKNVSKQYKGFSALSDISFQLKRGEIVALVGHNGAGKTTLMKLMLGLIQPSQGEVCINGQNPSGARGADVRREIGFLPENIAFSGAMTGLEVMAFYSRIKGEPAKKSASLLERVGLADAGARRVSTYSKGMRQRLGLAQALIGHPQLLLLDEPTTGLDPALRREFYTMLEELRSQGVAVILSSHALDEIESKADRFVLISKGRLLACDHLADLLVKTGLPVQISVQVATCTTQQVITAVEGCADVDHRTEDRLRLNCPQRDKVTLLRKIVDLGDLVRDVEINQPGLEAIYRSLQAHQGREELS